MPPKGSKRKGGRKAKTAPLEKPAPVDTEQQAAEPTVEDNQMNVDEETTQPEASISTSKATEVVSAVAHAITEAETVVEHAVEHAVEKAVEVGEAAKEFVEDMTMKGVEGESSSETPGNQTSSREESMQQDESREASQSIEAKAKLTLEERRAKMEELRKKMAAGTKANRQSLAEESAKAKLNARELARLERQRKLAETLRLKADAEERGEDVERKKNWDYTIEENDEWEKKLARKKRRADFEFHDDAQASRRRYKKDLDQIKPDLEAYNRQKALATGVGPSNALTSFSSSVASSSSAVQAVSSEEQRIASESLYRDANTLLYGDNKPSEEAIDRVVGKINKDIDKKAKFHRKRVNEDEGDITYINEHNRVFNKKIARYYDKYTAEIRASFERGTAL